MIKRNGITVNIKISPNAKRNEIIKDCETVKIKITAQPVEGKANKTVVEFLSKIFKIPKTSIKILKGKTSKEKTIFFETTDDEKLRMIQETFQNRL